VTLDRDKFPAVVIMVINFRVLQNSPKLLLAIISKDVQSNKTLLTYLLTYSMEQGPS